MPLFLLASGDGSEAIIVELVIILAVASGVTMALRRLRMATIPGYVIAGALIGPHALGLVADTEGVKSISELAILLLMFTIGLHLDISAIRVGLVHVMVLGAVTTFLSAMVGWGAALVAGLSPPVALTVGMALSMSSTAVMLRILQQRREMSSMHGRIIFGILIVQDMAALVILGVLPPIAEWAGVKVGGIAPEAAENLANSRALRMLLSAAVAIGGIAVLIFAGNRLLPRLLREAAKGGTNETLLVLSAAIALGAAALTKYLGFSAELGAFLAGFLLAATPFKYQLSGQLAPMRDLLMAVFFTSVGLLLDVVGIFTHWQTLVIGLPALLVGKSLIIGVGTWLSGATAGTSVRTGLSLAEASEFSLVVIAVAANLQILTGSDHDQAVGLVVVSLALAPSLYNLAEKLAGVMAHLPTARWMKNSPFQVEQSDPGATVGRRHVIIAGFGVVGRNLAEHFAAGGIPYTIVELNPTTVSRQRKLGRSIVFGDIANTEVLETAGIHHADAVILTIPDDEGTLRACRAIREQAPGAFIAARTSNLSRAIAATDLGADHVTVEEVATAQEMAHQVMARLRKREEAAAFKAEGTAPGAG